MFPYERAQVATLVELLAREPPARIIAVFGPRQSGKTTIVDQALARVRRTTSMEALYCAADAPEHSMPADEAPVSVGRTPRERLGWGWIIRHWEDARARAERTGGCVLVFDEIQEIDRWSTVVKGLWDADRFLTRRPQVVIVGSTPLIIQAGLTESLAGRFGPLWVGQWSFREMAEAFGFDLSRYLYFGGYPGVAALAVEGREEEWRRAVLDGCVRPAMERDLLEQARVAKPALMKRLFDICVRHAGQVVSLSRLFGRPPGVGSSISETRYLEIARYLELLEEVGLVTGLSTYTTLPLRRRLVPKMIVLDPALVTAASGYCFREAAADRDFRGRIVESAIGAHLYRSKSGFARLHYWRRGNARVDFVLRKGNCILAIEVRSGASSRYRSGVDAFCKRRSRARSLMVGEGGIPVSEFLSEPAGHWLSESGLPDEPAAERRRVG